MSFDSAVDDTPAIVEKFGERLVEFLRAGGEEMFQHVYYEPAGGDLDASAPTVCLNEAIYSLRQDLGADSRMRHGFGESVLEWGPGNNGKGPKRELREAGLSQTDRSEVCVYIAICDDSLLKDSKDENKCNEDKAKLIGSRGAVIDEISTDHKTTSICHSTLRLESFSFCSTSYSLSPETEESYQTSRRRFSVGRRRRRREEGDDQRDALSAPPRAIWGSYIGRRHRE